MILIHQISNSDLEYCDDIKVCLNHNLANPIINKIVIFSSCIDIEKKVGIDLKSRKLLLMKFDMSIFDLMNYGKKNSKDFVIYAAPFIKFDVDLANMLNFDVKKVLKDDYSYYIFNKNLKIKNERDIDDILAGEKIKIFFKTEKLGYYKDNDFQSISYGWRISKNIQKQNIPKITPKIDIPKVETIDIPEKIIEPIKNKYNTRKIDVVIVSVNYNDFLLISLENNSKIFENITVITSSNDFLCQKICKKFKVNCVVTNVMYENGAVFNKGKVINEGIRSIVDPDYILLLDADIVVIDKIDVDSLEDDVFYTSDRYMVNRFDSYQSYISGDVDKDSFLLDGDKGYGFFQLFNYAQDIKYPEFSNDASTDDIIFRDSFDLRKSIGKTILHLGTDSNWKGRSSKSFLSYEQFNNLLEKKIEPINKIFDDKPILKKNVIRKKNTQKKINLAGQIKFPGHRSGWEFAIDSLKPLHNKNGVKFDGFLEDKFSWKYDMSIGESGIQPLEKSGIVPYRDHWVGFIHNPHNMPKWFDYINSPQSIFERRIFQESLDNCLGLWALSEYQAKWLRKTLKVPVSVVYHPTDTNVPQFDFERFMSNRDKKIYQIGWWLRRVNSIYELPIESGYRKIRLDPKTDNYNIQSLYDKEAKELSLEIEERYIRNTFLQTHLSNSEYDEIYTENITFVNLYDASANNAVIEAIARATPILINPIDAVVEYLGIEYPFYYRSLSEATEKAKDKNLILETHLYLKRLEMRKMITSDFFYQSVRNSEVYKLI